MKNRGDGVIFSFVRRLLIIWVGIALLTTSTLEADVALPKEKGRQLFIEGAHDEALLYFQEALSKLETTEATARERGNLWLLIAMTHQQSGRYPQTLEALEESKTLVNAIEDVSTQIVTQLQISDLYLSIGKKEQSEAIGFEALEQAYDLEDPTLLSAALNNWGNILTVYKDYPEALSAYDESYVIASENNNTSLAERALLNLTQVATDAETIDVAIRALSRAVENIDFIDAPYESASLTLSLGIQAQQLSRISTQEESKKSLRQLAWQAFYQVEQQAISLENNRLRSYASGHLAELYEDEKRWDEALGLTRRAIFFAQQDKAPELLYFWQWQLGRLLSEKNDLDAAIVAYEQAVRTLNPIRSEIAVGQRNAPNIFRTRIKPVYYELADLYIRKAERSEETSGAEENLREAREIVETMKSAEMEDLFQDECVAAFQAKATGLDDLVEKVIVIYPIPFKNRLVVIASMSDKISHFTIPMGLEEFDSTVRELRRRLQTRSDKLFLNPSQKLYNALIRPLEEKMQAAAVDTIIIVPDGALSLIPLSTLHDGEAFLVEKYAIVTTPGLRLTDPQAIDREDYNSLIIGLSDAVQGYSALPNVITELEIIQNIIGGNVFSNEEYSAKRVTEELSGNAYRIMHMATHGEFDSNPDLTYLLTYNQKLTLNKLEKLIKLSRFRDEPVELLTLSACRTAVGDDKAALGLAGVAVKSGARSAIATLWFVDDEATMLTITEFYRQFHGNPDLSKAKSLQNAQKSLIAQARYWHPAYWAPFLLIGNWL